MKILLIGEKYASNLGDGLIFDTVKRNLIDEYKCSIVDLDISGRIDYPKITKPSEKKECIKKYLKKLPFLKKLYSKVELKKISIDEIDYAIFSGGQLFGGYFIDIIIFIANYLIKYNIPIIFNSIGLGLTNKKQDKKLKKLLNSEYVKSVSIRDNVDFFEKKYNCDKVIHVLDPVIDISNYIKIDNKCEKIIGLGIMDFPKYNFNNIDFTQDEFDNLLIHIINVLKENKLSFELFTNGAIDDFNYIKKFCERNNLNIKISKRPESPNELVELIGKYDKIISFRLHSHIIATSYLKPTIGFIWDKKIKDFSKIIERTNYFLELNKKTIVEFDKIFDDFIKEKQLKEINYKYKTDREYIKELSLK